ncbi:MAG: glycosyltransferase [Sphingobacteriales bacterium]|nr:MAG: glycosyltransferase [Sphingobacteriales bacterium]
MQQRNIHNHKKILFVTAPADGHFNPLTGLAKYLQALGYDVRWYTQDSYKERLVKLDIPHYPYMLAPQLHQANFETFFKERDNQKSQAAKFKFDLEHVFIMPATKIILDLEEIYKQFAFDLVIADIFSFVIPMIKARIGVPVIAAGIIPMMETSRDLPPAGLGLTPASNKIGKLGHKALRWITDNIIFKKPNRLFNEVLANFGASYPGKNIFDILYCSSDIVLQSCTPGFEYKRSDLSKNIRFAGPLLPFSSSKSRESWYDKRLAQYEKVVVLTQGTVEKDVNKLIIPTLEALKDSDTLIVCTTGGSQTAELKEKYNRPNIIIEDFIPFGDVMPYADLYITNGGYGGIMLGIQNELPLVVAGVHEGKNEICARVGYFNLGKNLKTETPRPEQIAAAVKEVLNNPVYKTNVINLREEFSNYDPNELCARYVAELTRPANSVNLGNVGISDYMQQRNAAIY